MITQRDIAKRLNMSQSTVAKVLKNSPNVWVSAENRERILGLARELNYRPGNRFGRYSAITCAYIAPSSQRMRMAFTIAIDVLGGKLEGLGYELKVKIFTGQEALLSGLNRVIAKRDSSACILWGMEDVTEGQGMLLEAAEMPFVVKGRFESDHPDWLQIDFDHEGMMARSVSRLAAMGHSRIAYLGQWDRARYVACLLRGYRDTMEKFGFDLPESYIVIGDASYESGIESMTNWLRMPEDEQPTALVLATGISSGTWHGVEKALFKAGRRMGDRPGEFPVTGTSFSELQLSIGHAFALRSIGLDALTEAMVDDLLAPLLIGETIQNRVVRLQPELVSVPSLELLD